MVMQDYERQILTTLDQAGKRLGKDEFVMLLESIETDCEARRQCLEDEEE